MLLTMQIHIKTMMTLICYYLMVGELFRYSFLSGQSITSDTSTKIDSFSLSLSLPLSYLYPFNIFVVKDSCLGTRLSFSFL